MNLTEISCYVNSTDGECAQFVVPLRNVAAALLGISDRQLARWQKQDWFPKGSGRKSGWDVLAIRTAADAQQLKTSEVSKQDREVKSATNAQKLRQEKIKADNLEREADREAGNILPRDEYALAIREHIVIARDSILPELLNAVCRVVPKQHHRHVQTEGRIVCEAVLHRLTSGLNELNADEEISRG